LHSRPARFAVICDHVMSRFLAYAWVKREYAMHFN
jgi:hypothetical protein